MEFFKGTLVSLHLAVYGLKQGVQFFAIWTIRRRRSVDFHVRQPRRWLKKLGNEGTLVFGLRAEANPSPALISKREAMSCSNFFRQVRRAFAALWVKTV